MIDINTSSKAEWFNLHLSHVTISSSIHRLVLHLVCAAIQSHVVVVGTQLTKVCSNADCCTHRPLKISLRVILLLKDLRRYIAAKKNSCNANDKSSDKFYVEY